LKEWYKASGLEDTINKIVDFLKVYIAAPIMGLKTYLTRAFVNLADKLWIPTINMDWGQYSKLSPISSLKKVFSFGKLYPLKDLVTDDMRESAAAAEDKSLQEIINEEMSKMQKNIEDKSNVKVEPEVKPPDSKQSHEIVM
jgi:protein subunit release factor A